MLKAPWYRPEDDLAFSLYVMEQEGELSTRQSEINKLIKIAIATGKIPPEYKLTEDEYNYIKKVVKDYNLSTVELA